MIDKNLSVPLYQQLKDALQKKIETDLNPGEMLPTEIEIEEMYNVSRVTVRRAIHELVLDGLIYKKQGKGTFVQEKKIIYDVERITSLTEEMEESGIPFKTISVDITEIVPSKKLYKKLKMEPDEKLVRIRRIREVNNEPFTIMVNYIRAKYVPGFLEKGLQQESLYSFLEDEYDVLLEKAEETVEAREATELEAELLNLQVWSPVLYLERLSCISGDIPVEYTNVTIRSDRYKYSVKLYGRKVSK